MMLDHLLVSAPLAGTNKSIEVLNADLPDEADPGADNDPRSHHAPVVATFALEP